LEVVAIVSAQVGPVDNRALLASIGHRRVRIVAGEVSRYAEALYAIVCERRPIGEGWTEGDWQLVLDELDTCDLTVREFLAAEHARKATR
jgi:hypothetical protein